MGLGIRIFIVENDDTIKRLPLARYERLFERDPDERLLEYAVKRVRYALIVVDLVNRRLIEIVRDEFGFLEFDDDGRLKVSEYEKQESLAFDMLALLLSDQTNDRIIDARHKFAKKRYFDKYCWTPTDEIVVGKPEAIFSEVFRMAYQNQVDAD